LLARRGRARRPGLSTSRARHPLNTNNPKVYLNKAVFEPAGSPADARGLAAFVSDRLPGVATANAYSKAGIAPADVVVFASPEFNVNYAREFIAAARPRMVVVFIHEPGMSLE
jgi:hypothetical protein